MGPRNPLSAGKDPQALYDAIMREVRREIMELRRTPLPLHEIYLLEMDLLAEAQKRAEAAKMHARQQRTEGNQKT